MMQTVKTKEQPKESTAWGLPKSRFGAGGGEDGERDGQQAYKAANTGGAGRMALYWLSSATQQTIPEQRYLTHPVSE